MLHMQGSDHENSGPYRRILAVKLADLGDLLSVTPALQALRSAHPHAQIDLIASPTSARILEGAPYLDNVIRFDGFDFIDPRAALDIKRLTNIGRFLWKMRLARYDALAVFHHATTSWGALERALLCLAVRAPATAGLDNALPHARFFTSRLTRRVPDRGFGALHEAGYWLAVAGALGADPQGNFPLHIPLNDEHRAFAGALLAQEGLSEQEPLVAIHPGAGAWSKARIWPAERFAEVARRLIDAHDAQIIVIGGPDEVETAQKLAGMISSKIRNPQSAIRNLAGVTSIHQTAALIERCSLFVGGDSGPMHIAVAVNTPVVAIFGPSNKEAWGPYTPPGQPGPHRVITRGLPCQPCFYRNLSLGLKDGCGTRPCLLGLGVEPVLSACAEILSSRNYPIG